MLKGQEDLEEVYRVAALTMQSLLHVMFGDERKDVHVVGNEHSYSLTIGGSSQTTTPERIREFSEDRTTFIKRRLAMGNCKGFIPATPEALEEITQKGMKVVEKGFRMEGIPYAKPGEQLNIYG
ncbi:hypothetical protein CL618_02885 [archaeon]|nr:hypothetical protein [archaeon]|tara:strand:- start:960 stop:1331 length:372 start_codon:yes stop_codon:yes gene_type:complete